MNTPVKTVRLQGQPIRGSGGGGKKGGTPKNAKNTLQSKATLNLQWLLGEGEIESVDQPYFDGTPLTAEDGTVNFKGVDWSYNVGTPDQDYLTGNSLIETPHDINHTLVSYSNGAVVRTVTEENADSCRIITSIPALYRVKKGALKTTSVSYQVKVRPYGGNWAVVAVNDLRSQKCTSLVQFAHEFDLPKGGHPWDIAVERLTADSEDDNLQNDVYWDSYYSIVKGRFTYPNSAIVEMTIDTKDFGSSVPQITFGGKWLKTPVPSNYDPIARTYTGIWDGTFKTVWHRNPAWVLYDLVINDRYGLGEFVDLTRVDKWSFNTIAKYCDELVPDGFGGMEPRYSFDGSISTRMDAYDLLRKVANVFRGVTYWALGQVYAVADMPGDSQKLFTAANTVPGDNGSFEYSGTAMSARHSAALVGWNDPNDHSKPATELIINDEMMQRYGWRQTETALLGTQVRGQAYRFGEWVLDTEQHETETVQFQASWDAAELKPFDIISIADENKAGVRLGGRVVAVSADKFTVTLDAPFEPSAGETYYLMVTLPDGTLETQQIDSFNGADVLLSAALSIAPLTESVWEIKGTDVNPRQYRVMLVSEDQPHLYSVTGIQHDPTKYARVEQSLKLDDIQYSRPSKSVAPPTNLAVVEDHFYEEGAAKCVITLSWSPGNDFMSTAYDVVVLGPGGTQEFRNQKIPSVEIPNISAGDYEFSIVALGYNGIRSESATLDYTAIGWAGTALPVVAGLKLVNGSAGVFTGSNIEIAWVPTFSQGPAGPSNPFHDHTEVKVYDVTVVDAPVLLRTDSIGGADYVYTLAKNVEDNKARSGPTRFVKFEVTIYDTEGRSSLPVDISVSNPAPAAPTVSVTAGIKQAFISWKGDDDIDLQGSEVHVSLVSGFTPDATTLKYRGAGGNGSYADPENDIVPHYVRVGCYDSFQPSPSVWSSEFSVTPLDVTIDTTPPAVPTGLALSSVVSAGDPGFVIMTATWDANTEEDLAYYDVQIKEDTGNWVSFTTSELEQSWRTLSGISFTSRIRAVDKVGNQSDFSAEVQHTTIIDSDSPGVPTNFVVSAGLGATWLKWSNPADLDFIYVEIWENTVDDINTATQIAVSHGTSFAVTGLALDQTRYYWLRAVDTSGNKSAFTTSKNATTGSIPDTDQIAVQDILFSQNNPGANTLSWTAGTITYGLPGSIPTQSAISAGSVAWTAGYVYVYYVKGDTTLSTATDLPTMYAASGILLGVYKGDTDFQLVEGQTYTDGGLILAGTIGALQLVTNSAVITSTAQIKDAIITSAKIVSLEAVKIIATDIESNNALIGLINGANVLIEPGKVQISGSNSLSSWIYGGDNTSIDGGAVAANTISANKLTIGQRGIATTSLKFTSNDPDANSVSWNAGWISYVKDDGTTNSIQLAVGSATAAPGTTVFITWVKDAAVLTATNSVATAYSADRVVLAIYSGGTNLTVNNGQTIIDGDHIKTGTITATQADITSFRTSILQANVITSTMIQAGAITASKMVLTDPTNLIPDNQMQDIAGSWTIGTGWGVVNTPGFTGSADSKAIYHTYVAGETGYFGFSATPYFPVDGLQQYRATWQQFGTNGTSNLLVRVHYLDANGASMDALGASGYTTLSAVSGTGTVQNMSATFTPINGARQAHIRIYSDRTNMNGVIQFASPKVLRKDAASLIVDGSITATMIATGAITADNADINSLTAAILTTDSITSTMLAADSVTSDKINVTDLHAISATLGAVDISSAIVGTLQVDTANIKNLSVTTLKIANDAITKKVSALTSTAISISTSVYTQLVQVRATSEFTSGSIDVSASFTSDNGGSGTAGFIVRIVRSTSTNPGSGTIIYQATYNDIPDDGLVSASCTDPAGNANYYYTLQANHPVLDSFQWARDRFIQVKQQVK